MNSNGNVNTVDVIMPMAPIFYVLSPEYIKLLLHPVLYYLHSGAWPHNYTIHDMGAHYPNATGHDDGEAQKMPIEESGNLLALLYMYELASGDTEYKNEFLETLQIFADYLVENGLHPVKQFSTDDGAGEAANQTGLAVKSAIALNAYGIMTNQPRYSDIGRHFADILYNQTEGTDPARTRFTMFQGEGDTWSLQFNLYLDVLLKLNTFPTEAYRMQTDFYPTVRKEAGVPLDSRDSWAKTDWMVFAAATAMAPGVSDEGVRDMFINDIHAYISNGKNDAPFSDKFWTESKLGLDGKEHEIGSYDGYRARPVAGGHFALLALEGANQWQGGKK
jgi:hypothetical protein